MENTEVMNVEEIEVIEPVIAEVEEEAAENTSIGAVGGFVAGAIVAVGAVALWKFAIKPGAMKIKAKIEEKKCARDLRKARPSDDDVCVTTVDFEEVEESDNE